VLEPAPILLIAVGSDVVMMEALTTHERPLYGRPTRQLVVEPLRPAEIARLLGIGGADAVDADMRCPAEQYAHRAASARRGTAPRTPRTQGRRGNRPCPANTRESRLTHEATPAPVVSDRPSELQKVTD